MQRGEVRTALLVKTDAERSVVTEAMASALRCVKSIEVSELHVY